MGKNNSSGFSAIELMVTMGIGIVLMVLAGSLMANWLPAQHLKASTRKLQSAIQFARMESVRLNTEVCVEFDLDNNECSLCVEAIRDGSCDVGQGDQILKSMILSTGVDFFNDTVGTPEQTFVHFNSRGIPSNNGQLHLKDNRGEYRGITIGLTGMSKVIKSDDGAIWH